MSSNFHFLFGTHNTANLAALARKLLSVENGKKNTVPKDLNPLKSN